MVERLELMEAGHTGQQQHCGFRLGEIREEEGQRGAEEALEAPEAPKAPEASEAPEAASLPPQLLQPGRADGLKPSRQSLSSRMELLSTRL